MNTQRAGARAERLARDYLCERGLQLLRSNYRCRWGEIDLIMRDDDCIVFVEVRLRRHTGFGGAAGSIAPHKQARIGNTALDYLGCVEQSISLPCRFDVVAIDSEEHNIRWLRDAFRPAH